MPNQRAKGKKIVGAWVDDKTVAKLDELAAIHKVNRAEIIKAIIQKGLQNNEGINSTPRRSTPRKSKSSGKKGS